MKIKAIILNVLFIIILICLIYFFIYLNNSNFENFINNPLADDTSDVIVDSTNIDSVSNQTVASEYTPKPEEIINNGFSQKTPLVSVDYAYVLEKHYKNTIGTTYKPNYTDGYYWINIKNAGSKYIYCIMDKDYAGGGWMLALRSVYGSKNFSYDSDHFKFSTTLNDDPSYITKIIKDLDEKDFKISSIGNKIYSTDGSIKPDEYDAKFDTFNHSDANEWMAIFYLKDTNDKTRTIIGGDIKAPNNKRGWIWKETNVKNTNIIDGVKKEEPISALKLFNILDKNGGDIINNNPTNIRDLTIKYHPEGQAQNMGGKFLIDRKDNKKNQIFSSQEKIDKKSFYGMNYDRGHPYSKVRWGFNFNDANDNTNDAFSGIGTSVVTGLEFQNNKPPINEKGYSAGNFEMTYDYNTGTRNEPSKNKFKDRPYDSKINELYFKSYAVEWYVR